MLQKAKSWLKEQDWRRLATTPLGAALLIGTIWSISHRIGLMKLIDGGDQDEDQDRSNTWHARESAILTGVIFASLYFYGKNALQQHAPTPQNFEDAPKGSRWMIVPDNASIMLPGQEVAQTQAMPDPYDGRFIKGPPPF